MASNLAKAAAAALALSGGGENLNNNENNNPTGAANDSTDPVTVPECPYPRLSHYHDEEVCLTRNVRLPQGHVERQSIYERLKGSGTGATLIPNQQTIICPLELQSLESSSATKGLDTTWIVENTGSKPVFVSWVVDGVEWSPFEPDIKAMEDPKAVVKPGEWLNIPTFDSFVYHVREIEDDGGPGSVVLQHRMGLIPLGNPNQLACDANSPDVEPVHPETAVIEQDFARKAFPPRRPCNTIDLGFRNQVGCPLHVYWANSLDDVPTEGFTCGERFRFHMGTKPATQDFMQDWESSTKFEGSYIGHTFVARLASDPNVVVDSYTTATTKVVDCPKMKQQVASASQKRAEAVVEAEGTVLPSEDQVADAIAPGASVMAGAGVGSH